MYVNETLRRLCSGIAIVVILAVSLPALADGEANEITSANQLIDDGKYDDAIAILAPIISSADPVGRQAKEALEGCYRRAGKWDKAVPILESLASDYPTDAPSCHARLAGCYEGLGDYAKAVAAVKTGLESSSVTPDARAVLTQHLWRCCIATNDWNAAVSVFQSLLAKQPQNAVEWNYRLCRSYRGMGKSAEAAAALEKAKELVSSDVAGQIALAQMLIDDKEYDDASAILTPITSTESVARQAKETLEGCYRRAGQWNNAIPILDSLARDFPEDTPAWQSLLAGCHAGLGDHAKAIAAAKAGLDFTPLTSGARATLSEHIWRGYIATNDWNAALSMFQSLLAKDIEGAAEWHYQVGRCYRKLGRNAEGHTALEMAVDLASGTPDAVAKMAPEVAVAYYDAGEFASAESLLGISYPRSYIATHMIRNVHDLQSKRDYANAIVGYQYIVDRFPDRRAFVESAHVCIAECLQSLGRSDEGMAYAKRIYDEEPDMRGGALFAEGLLSISAKDYEASAAAFRRVIAEYPDNQHVGYAKSSLVSALQLLRRYDEAVDLLKQSAAAQSIPEDRDSELFRLANICVEAEKFSDAVVLCEKLAVSPSLSYEYRARATYLLACCQRQLGELDLSESSMRAVIERYPTTDASRDARPVLDVWSAQR